MRAWLPSSNSSCSDEMRSHCIVDQLDRVTLNVLKRKLEMLGPRRSRVARATSGSRVTTFISVSWKSECAFRFADPTVSQRSSTIPIFECT